MTHAASRIIREEHAAHAAMFRAMLQLLAQHRREGTLPDFSTLRAMQFYVDEFPEKRHRCMESELLVPKLRTRTPLSRDLLDRLEDDHARGELKLRNVERALLAFEMLGEPRRRAFETALESYVDFYFAHMAVEEREILPLADLVLTDEDWKELDTAFASHHDPLTGQEGDPEYAGIFLRIAKAMAVPAVPAAPGVSA
jgi:hemerythrin-like domain-containing protein